MDLIAAYRPAPTERGMRNTTFGNA